MANVFKSSTIYGVLRNSDNTTASPNILASALFDRDVDVTGKVVTDRINSKTGRIDMSGNTIDISGNTIYLGHTGATLYVKDIPFNPATYVTLNGIETLTNKTLASPTFTGTPIAPTATAGTNTTQLATTAFVLAQSFITSAALSGYALLASPTFTGIPAAPTASVGDNTTQIATTAFVKLQNYLSSAALSGYALLSSPTFTGTPAAPTATTATNTTQLATTAYVKNQGYAGLATNNAFTGTTNTISGVSMYRNSANNTSVGFDSLPTSSTSSYDNFALGTGVMKYMTTGNNNTGIGNYVLGLATTATESVGVGVQALSQVLTGGKNTAIGFCSSQIATGSRNTSIGNSSGITLTSGTNNTYIGCDAGGGGITTGSYNTSIGESSGKHNFSNTTCIGYSSVATANNQIILGTTSEEVIINGNLNSSSILIKESGTLNLKQNSAGAASIIQWLDNAGSGLALAYASTSSNAFNFNAQPALTNGFKFLVNGIEKASISLSGQLSAVGQPKVWYLNATISGNASAPAGRNLGSAYNTTTSYWNSVTTFGGATAGNWNSTTGVFTANEAGLYSFFVSIFNNGTATSGRFLQFGGTGVINSNQYAVFNQNYLSGEGSFTTQVNYYLTSGQTFFWACPNASPVFYFGAGHTNGIITKIY